MANLPLFIGIDGGGSKCRAIITDNNNNVLGSGVSGAANAFQNLMLCQKSIVEAAEKALVSANINGLRISELIAGIGLAGVNVPSAFIAMSQWQHPFAQLHLTNDLHIACLGAHGGENGAIIVTGTGSCGYRRVNEHSLMLGGYGFAIGDQASGAWFGQQLVKHVLLSLDKLAPATKMSVLLLNKLNCHHALEIVERVANQSSSFYGQLAAIVFDAAADNDALALGIIKQASDYISAIGQRLCQDESLDLAMIGGLALTLKPYLSDDLVSQLVRPNMPPEMGAIHYAKQQMTS
ncbi:MAG: ATPase [Psychrobium sp.]|nr:ATPase [Psychrobium sp.]